MIQELIQIIKTELATNEFMSGGLAVAVFSGLLYISRQIPAKIYNFVDRNLVWTIRINNDNSFYESFSLWASDFLQGNTKRLKVEKNFKEEKFLGLNYGIHWRFFGGSFFVIETALEEASNILERKESITIKIYSLRGKSALDNLLNSVSKFDPKNIMDPYFYDHNWSWNKIKPISKRDMDSIFLEESIKIEVLESINGFLGNREFYDSIGLIYKYSIIFHGDPGTGKSSLIVALGSYYKKNLCYLDLSLIGDGGDLKRAFSAIPENSILILEDIDCHKVTKSRETLEGEPTPSEEKINLSTVLQLMDGMYLPDGTVVIATTNYLEKLDKAFIREGRFDKKIELKKANKELALKMCESINPDRKEEIEKMEFPASQAKIQGILIK